mgnify:CR=1 FL=1
MTDPVKWIALDRGTSNLRLWAIGPGGQVVGTRECPEGMGVLNPEDYEPALVDLAGPLFGQDQVTPVIACDMFGACKGWVEAAYVPTPYPPLGMSRATRAPTSAPRVAVSIPPCVSQAGQAEDMREEETQIVGYLAQDTDFDGNLCLPGTHAKWVHIGAGELVSFCTFMTGEPFAFLSRLSGLLAGLEIAGAKDYWLGSNIAQAAADIVSASDRYAPEV